MGTYGHDIQKAVRAQLRAEIAAKGMKQADVTRAVGGMHSSTLSRYLNDEELAIPFWVLADIAKALGLEPVKILERAERRMREEAEEATPGPSAEGGHPLGIAATAE